jgi:hypothetical protein
MMEHEPKKRYDLKYVINDEWFDDLYDKRGLGERDNKRDERRSRSRDKNDDGRNYRSRSRDRNDNIKKERRSRSTPRSTKKKKK